MFLYLNLLMQDQTLYTHGFIMVAKKISERVRLSQVVPETLQTHKVSFKIWLSNTEAVCCHFAVLGLKLGVS